MTESAQIELPIGDSTSTVQPLRGQLLKWIGNKQRFALEIIRYFPSTFGRYFEPFLGSGAVLATLGKPDSFGSDTFGPLVNIWQTLASEPTQLKHWYEARWDRMAGGEKIEEYERVKRHYNENPNPADLLFLSRSCYGGVVRFRRDGYMSTPCGAHKPMPPSKFSLIVDRWHERVRSSVFVKIDYDEAMRLARPNDLIYCDPPYSHTQAILYGAQSFKLEHLFEVIELCKNRGVFVALSIDGSKKSGAYLCGLPIPDGLFEREIYLTTGRSMLRRFQMVGQSLESEVVRDRLLLTY